MNNKIFIHNLDSKYNVYLLPTYINNKDIVNNTLNIKNYSNNKCLRSQYSLEIYFHNLLLNSSYLSNFIPSFKSNKVAPVPIPIPDIILFFFVINLIFL